jgi:very-short-patch-repair endonuclease
MRRPLARSVPCPSTSAPSRPTPSTLRCKRVTAPPAPQRVAPRPAPSTPEQVQRFAVPSEPENVARQKATLLLRSLAEKQHGVLAWRQLIELGLTEGQIKSRLNDGQLVPLHRGVFALGHRHIGLYGEWMAAVLACGPGAVLSHGTAAQLWGIRGSRKPIEVTRVSGHRRPHGVRLHQTRSLPAEHITVEAGIPVTTLERTFLDNAPRLDEKQLEHDLAAADRSRRLRWPNLWLVLSEHGRGRKGVKRLKRVAAEADPRLADAVSASEVDFLILCREEGLKMPQVNVLVEGKKVDFYWPKERLIVEADSYGFHGDPRAFELDHQSTVDLEVAGYRVHRTTYKMLQANPGPFLSLVAASLAAT